MGNNLEVFASYTTRRVQMAAVAGQSVLNGIDRPKIFFQGNEFWKVAAGITGEAVHPPEHFEPQNYPRPTQPIAERQGEQ